MKVIKGVNFPSYLFASLVAGYVMMAVDMMFEGFLGLFGTYKDYIELIKIWGIFEGLEDWIMTAGHMINSVVLALFFVHPSVYFRLPKNRLLKGLTFGVFWHILVILVLMVGTLGGSEFLKNFLFMDLRHHISLFILHMVWSLTLSILYFPEKFKRHVI